MSFIQSTIKCKSCGREMNIALGTFGTGMPQKCPECGVGLDDLTTDYISQGWNAKQI